MGKDKSSGRLFDTATKFEEVSVVVDGEPAPRRTLGVSLLGACSSKGCPTKSVENEDRYVHVSWLVDCLLLSFFFFSSCLFALRFLGVASCFLSPIIQQCTTSRYYLKHGWR